MHFLHGVQNVGGGGVDILI